MKKLYTVKTEVVAGKPRLKLKIDHQGFSFDYEGATPEERVWFKEQIKIAIDRLISKAIKQYKESKQKEDFANVNSRIEKRSELMEKLYNTYILNVEDSGMPKASVMELVKLHEECADALYGC